MTGACRSSSSSRVVDPQSSSSSRIMNGLVMADPFFSCRFSYVAKLPLSLHVCAARTCAGGRKWSAFGSCGQSRGRLQKPGEGLGKLSIVSLNAKPAKIVFHL